MIWVLRMKPSIAVYAQLDRLTWQHLIPLHLARLLMRQHAIMVIILYCSCIAPSSSSVWVRLKCSEPASVVQASSETSHGFPPGLLSKQSKVGEMAPWQYLETRDSHSIRNAEFKALL